MPGPGQIGIHGPFEIPYVEGTFVPVPHSFVIVGTVNFWGRYTIIGDVLFYTIGCIGVTPADTITSTAGVSYFTGMPRIPSSFCPSCFAADGDTCLGFGCGLNHPAGEIYPAAWAANDFVFIGGKYFIA